MVQENSGHNIFTQTHTDHYQVDPQRIQIDFLPQEILTNLLADRQITEGQTQSLADLTFNQITTLFGPGPLRLTQFLLRRINPPDQSNTTQSAVAQAFEIDPESLEMLKGQATNEERAMLVKIVEAFQTEGTTIPPHPLILSSYSDIIRKSYEEFYKFRQDNLYRIKNEVFFRMIEAVAASVIGKAASLQVIPSPWWVDVLLGIDMFVQIDNIWHPIDVTATHDQDIIETKSEKIIQNPGIYPHLGMLCIPPRRENPFGQIFRNFLTYDGTDYRGSPEEKMQLVQIRGGLTSQLPRGLNNILKPIYAQCLTQILNHTHEVHHRCHVPESIIANTLPVLNALTQHSSM